jgi:uncharacterized lipoprotein YmbA
VLVRPILMTVAMLALTGCVSLKRTPEARLFALRATAPRAAGTYAGGDLVGVMPVHLPAHLDRPQLVSWSTQGELRVDEFLRWGEPLDMGTTRVLADDLDLVLPDHPSARHPWPAGSPLLCRVSVHVERFGAQAGREVRLEGRFTLLPRTGERPLVVHPFRIARDVAPLSSGADDPEAVVDAMSQLVGELATQIAAEVQKLPAPPAPG